MRGATGGIATRWALWVLAVSVVAPVALALTAPVLPGWWSALVYAGASLVCHQRPDRSFEWGAAQFAVCARCTGIYVGAAVASVAAACLGTRAAPCDFLGRGPGTRMVLMAGAAPTIATVVAEVAGGWATSDYTRFVAGLPLGASVVVVLAAAVAMTTLHYE